MTRTRYTKDTAHKNS